MPMAVIYCSNAEIPFFVCVIRYIARNQVRSGNFVLARIVPAVIETWYRQPLHWYRARL